MRRQGHVLVEAPERDALAHRAALEFAGYETRWCPGPDDCDGSTCGLVSEHRCSLVDWADVVVNALGVQRSETRHVLQALTDTHPDLPVVVETGTRSAETWAPMLHHDEVVTAPATAEELVSAVVVALAKHRHAGDDRFSEPGIRMGRLSGFCSAPELL